MKETKKTKIVPENKKLELSEFTHQFGFTSTRKSGLLDYNQYEEQKQDIDIEEKVTFHQSQFN